MNRQFNKDDFINADFSYDVQFHVLKHFSKINKEYLDLILNKTDYLPDEVEEQLKVLSSKFYPEIISNPDNLYDILIKEVSVNGPVARWTGTKCELQVIFREDHYPSGIGNNCMLHISDLSDEEKEGIFESTRDGLKIKVIRSVPEPTFKVNIILYRNEDNIQIVSIFPGDYAPPLPDKDNQPEDQFLISQKFWKNHVFIEAGKQEGKSKK